MDAFLTLCLLGGLGMDLSARVADGLEAKFKGSRSYCFLPLSGQDRGVYNHDFAETVIKSAWAYIACCRLKSLGLQQSRAEAFDILKGTVDLKFSERVGQLPFLKPTMIYLLYVKADGRPNWLERLPKDLDFLSAFRLPSSCGSYRQISSRALTQVEEITKTLALLKDRTSALRDHFFQGGAPLLLPRANFDSKSLGWLIRSVQAAQAKGDIPNKIREFRQGLRNQKDAPDGGLVDDGQRLFMGGQRTSTDPDHPHYPAFPCGSLSVAGMRDALRSSFRLGYEFGDRPGSDYRYMVSDVEDKALRLKAHRDPDFPKAAKRAFLWPDDAAAMIP